MPGTKPLKTGRPKNKPELKKLTSERIRALQTAQKTSRQEKSWVEDGSENSVKQSHQKREKSPTSEKAIILSSKRTKTTKKNSWVDNLSKFPMKQIEKKKEKKTLKRQSKCHVFVKQVCFSYGESPRTPPLEGTSLHRRNISVERPWGILSLFTTCLPLWVKSSRQCRCHVSPTQELMTCILRRQRMEC